MSEQDWAEKKTQEIFRQALGDLEIVAGQSVVDDFIKLFSLALKQERKIEWPTEDDMFEQMVHHKYENFDFDLGFVEGVRWTQSFIKDKLK